MTENGSFDSHFEQDIIGILYSIDLFRTKKNGRVILPAPRAHMPMATHTVFFEIGCKYHGFPKNNVSQPFLRYSESLSEALICDSANITNNQNTARRLFVPVYMAG